MLTILKLLFNLFNPRKKENQILVKVLTEDAESDYLDFLNQDSSCSCHINPPCYICTHPGNPLGLIESDYDFELVNVEESNNRIKYDDLIRSIK
ncbi:hypothetical protein [Methylocucumis oryzae]|uniref:Uncharacterized protein n=1 Tax=Methylocucumis oryzae TaxID=1632867 RepID=A0A0F3IN68_9GAMM|nr:hypothetical protein [Methylocucumis oryzae]KJV08003.1 hypothetical protein VZ94_00870 [Methylocucumis oryzae]